MVQRLLKAVRGTVSVFLVSVLLMTGACLTFPQEARAGDIIVMNCEKQSYSQCTGKVEEGTLSDVAKATGYVAGIVGDVAAISSMGTVAGLSGAGITSGLAAIGSLVGGGMVAGVVITAAVPAVAAIATGAALYHASQVLSGGNSTDAVAQIE